MDGVLHYHEAWHGEEGVIEHWGVAGDPGETQTHGAADKSQARDVLAKLEKDVRANGFRSIPPSRHAMLVVEYQIDGFGHEIHLERRHQIEDKLGALAMLLGLGQCDGGSTGAGTMEVALNVVDFDLAKTALAAAIKGSFMDGYARMYRAT